MASKERETHFEKGPIVRTLLVYCLPILVSQLLQQVYNITDCIVVGHFCGSYGLAATGLAGFILAVLVNFFIGFSTGAGIIVAQEFGAYRYDNVKKTIVTIVNLGLVLGIALTVAGCLMVGQILSWIACPAEMLDDTALYLTVCFTGLMPQLVYNIANAVLRSLGDTRSPVRYLLASTALNLVLDIVLVVGLNWGLFGAACATVAAQWLLFALITVRIWRMDDAYSYRPTSRMTSPRELVEILKLSIPSGLQAVFMSISTLVLQVTINSFGPSAVAGITVFAKVEGFLYYPAFSYGIALTSFVGQNYGAGRIDRVRESVRLSLIGPTIGIFVLSLGLILAAEPILCCFTDDADILRNGLEAIRWIFPMYFAYMICQIYMGALKGLGKAQFPMVCTLVCYCIFRVAWCMALIGTFNSMVTVYTSYIASWVIMFVMLVAYYHKLRIEPCRLCDMRDELSAVRVGRCNNS